MYAFTYISRKQNTVDFSIFFRNMEVPLALKLKQIPLFKFFSLKNEMVETINEKDITQILVAYSRT